MAELENFLDLKRIKINIDNLLLDPNNPRFCKHADEMVDDKDIEKEKIQEKTFVSMMNPAFHFDIETLASSIKSKGFVNVDNVFVRKIKDKYLVIEGNRRITAVKLLLKEHVSGKGKSKLSKELLENIKTIDCIDLTDRSKSEIDFILGLRHHGSIKQWKLLPSSFSIFYKYKEEFEKAGLYPSLNEENIMYDQNIAGRVSILYSVERPEVRDKIRAYRAYLQLRKIAPNAQDLQDKFDILFDALVDKKFRESFEFNEESCTFSEEGTERFLKLILGNDKINPVIRAPSSGEASLRDYLYVLKNGTSSDIERMEVDGELPSAVKGDLKSRENKRDLYHCLEEALKELQKIRFYEVLKEVKTLGEHEKEVLGEIEEIIDEIKLKASKKK